MSSSGARLIVLDVVYGGRLEAAAARSRSDPGAGPAITRVGAGLDRPDARSRFLYSNRVAVVSAGRLVGLLDGRASVERAVGVSGRRVRQPATLIGCCEQRSRSQRIQVDSGRRVPGGSPGAVSGLRDQPFHSDRPASRRGAGGSAAIRDPPGAAGRRGLNLEVVSTSRMTGRNRQTPQRVASMLAVVRERSRAKCPIPTSRWRRSTTICPADIRRRTSRSSISRCRRRRTRGRRSGGVRRHLRAPVSGARSGASVVGPGGRLEELSRAMAERRTGAVLCGAVCGRGSRRRRMLETLHRRHAQDRRAVLRPGADLRSATGSATSSATVASSAPSSTTSPRSSCTCCGVSLATRPSSGA